MQLQTRNPKSPRVGWSKKTPRRFSHGRKCIEISSHGWKKAVLWPDGTRTSSEELPKDRYGTTVFRFRGSGRLKWIVDFFLAPTKFLGGEVWEVCVPKRLDLVSADG